MKRYAIWNKKDPVYTLAGEKLTASEWIDRYKVAGKENVTVLLSAGAVNGEYFGILETEVSRCERLGCDFSACTTDEEKLAAIEAFEDAREAAELEAIAEARARENMQADSLASIAASLEYQNMMTLEDVEG